jgi:hypothetical protein
MTSPYLPQEEINEMCEPLKSGVAQIRHLRQQGFTVMVKPSGKALVLKAHRDEVLCGINTASKQPHTASNMNRPKANKEALILAFRKS